MSLSPEPGDVAAEESSSATGDNARGSVCGGWVSLTGDGNPFDINLGLARCRYSVADYAGTVHGDAVVVVPAEFRFASQMIAHAVLPADGRCGGLVEIAVRRPSVRCAKPYRFAYVGGRLCDVMAISGAFGFVHGDDGLCDCDDAAADDLATEPFSSAEPRLSAAFGIGAFVSSVMDRRSSAQRCPVCAIPSNHRLVLTHLTENIDRLSVVDANFHRLHKKYTECLNNCNSLLEYQKLKTKILSREMENGKRFVEGLVSSLLKYRKAIFRTGDDTITVKLDEKKCSVNERFMNSIISSQNQKIASLTAKYEEILILMNTMRLFSNML